MTLALSPNVAAQVPAHVAEAEAAANAAFAYLISTPAEERGLNLGCGGQPFAGWLNIDSDHPYHVQLRWDLRRGLPFLPDATFAYAYSEHFLEHIPRKDGAALMRDLHRILHPGGRIRIAMPDLDKVVRDYVDDVKHPEAHGEFRGYFGDLYHTRGELLDIAMRQWGHTYLYNYEDLELLLARAGFTEITRVGHRISKTTALEGRETRPPDQSCLIAEALRP